MGLDECEDIWLRVADPFYSNYNVIALYRHPNSNTSNFIHQLDEALEESGLA